MLEAVFSSSLLREAQRTFDTFILLPWIVFTTPTSSTLDSPATAQVTTTVSANDSFKWILIQLLVVYLFYRLIAPFRSNEKVRRYFKLRTAMDIWLFTALVIKSPTSSNDNDKISAMRLFVSVFAIFLAASHVALAAFTIIWHIVGFIVHRVWPSLVDMLFLPNGQTFNPPSISSLVQFSCTVSMAMSLVFVGCTIEAKAVGGHDIEALPSICQPIYSVTDAEEDVYYQLGYLKYLTHLSLWDSPIGLIWLSCLALYVIFYLTRRSTRLALRIRFVNAVRRGASARTLDRTVGLDSHGEDNLFFNPFKPAPTSMPNFLPMSEWYSVAIIDTAVDVLISIKLFFGRFDPRSSVKPEMGTVAAKFNLADDEEEEFVWDWIADTGDGGNSTYLVAKYLAKPNLFVHKDRAFKKLVGSHRYTGSGDLELPRARLLIIGGDLAYPGPSIENYERRLWVPFGDALEPPIEFRKDSVSISKLHTQEFYTNEDAAPVCYCIPGNHDMYDGLSAFNRCILNRDWLGGWRLPQTTTYFALQLPRNWWIFALDQGLGEDIDVQQFRYFQDLASRIHGRSIIVVSHEPVWIYDAYAKTHQNGTAAASTRETRAPLLKELIHSHLQSKIGLRVCGDLHNYMRYESPVDGVNLVVSGGGGAFLHPTHTFPNVVMEHENTLMYELKNAFPDVETSRRLGYDNLGNGFRTQNWRFDVVGSVLYFAVVFSLFPRCGIATRLQLSTGAWDCFAAYAFELASMLYDMFAEGYISPLCLLGAMGVCIAFAEKEHGWSYQLVLGLAHAVAHLVFALNCFIVVQLVLEIAISDGLMGKSYYALFESYFTDDSVAGSLKQISRMFDVTEAMAVPHQMWCFNVLPAATTLGRYDILFYYFASFAYLYVLTADVFSLVIGVYLAICASVLKCQWNESFSSLRNPHYKHFIRFKITKSGDMHCFVLGIDKTPEDWIENSNYESTQERMDRMGILDPNDPRVASYNAASPSKWHPSNRKMANKSVPQLVDFFEVKRDPVQ